MSMGEEYMNDFAYEYEQSLEKWDIEEILDKAIEEYINKAREVAEILRIRRNRKNERLRCKND